MRSKEQGRRIAAVPPSPKGNDMKLHDNLRSITLTAAVSAALTLGAVAALAQPAGGPWGPGPHWHGPHGPGAPEQMIGRLIENAKAQLNLNTSQQLQFDAAVASGKAARDSGQALRQKVKDAMTAELAKSEPDLAAVAAVADDAQQQGQVLRKSVRSQWLALYATFTPDQKAAVRDALQKAIANAETMRQRMQNRFKAYPGGTGG
jgi:Spy/CpxP family protein refolding chaperone